MAIALGLFERSADAERAVDMLINRGFGKEEIGVVARDNRVPEHLQQQTGVQDDTGSGIAGGALLGGVGGLLAGFAALAIPGIGAAVAAGAFASVLGLPLVGAGAGAAAGGLIGGLVASNVSEEDAHAYAEGVKRGGVLVSVKVSEGRVAEAQQIMNEAGAVDIDARRAEWRRDGWTYFDEADEGQRDAAPERPAHPPETPRTDPLIELETDKGGT